MDIDIADPFVVYSENMVGIDYVKLRSHSALLELVRMSEEMGLYYMEFDTERPEEPRHTRPEISFDDMKFVKGEW